MKSHKRALKNIARNYKLDSDELLVTLWDYSDNKEKFSYLINQNSVVKNDDISLVKKILKSKFGLTDLKETVSEISKPVRLIIKKYDFASVGKTTEPILYLTEAEALRIHKELVEDFNELSDHIYPPGLKDKNLLGSALFHAQTSYDHKAKYPTVESCAAALMYSLSNNHAFHNGNKRTAMVAMLVFLDKHNICLLCSEDDLFRVSVKVADHKMVSEEYLYSDAEIYELAKWVHFNSKIMKKGERPITLKRFKQILTSFGCDVLGNGKVRRIKKSVFLGIPREKVLLSKNSIGETISDGHELDRELIKSIREDLELDTTNGTDSEMFYSYGVEFSGSEFIIKYKNLLKRLSKI